MVESGAVRRGRFGQIVLSRWRRAAAPATTDGDGIAALEPPVGQRGLSARTPADGRRLLGIGGGIVIALSALTAMLTVVSQHAFAANSDSATVLLEGVAISHGHLGLAGWTFAYDSFWSIDAIGYALGAIVDGVSPVLMHVIPAAIAAGVVLVGAYVAAIGHRGRVRVAAVAATIVPLVLPSHALAFFLLQGPWHIGTTLYCLIAFCALRHGGFTLRWVVGVVFLSAALLGDLQAAALGVGPVVAVGVTATIRRRSVRDGAATLAAAPASVLFALAVRAVATRLGTFDIVSGHRTANGATMRASARLAVNWITALFGIHPGPYGGAHIPTVVGWAHGAGAIVALVGVCAAIVTLVRTTVRPPEPSAEPALRLEQLLLFAFFGNLLEFEVLTLSANTLYARYLTASLIFATILGARTVAPIVADVAARPRATATGPRRTITIGGTALVVGGITAAYATDVVVDVAQPAPSTPVAHLVAFLENHNLHLGLGEYWGASIVTVESHDAVRVRPIAATHTGLIERDGHQSTRYWYDGRTFQYLVYEQLPYGRITPKSVAKTYGAPAHTYKIDQYTVAVWSHPIPISTASVS